MRIYQHLLLVASFLLNSCAVLHHVQLGDIDSTSHKSKKIDVKISETGINLQEANAIIRRLGNQNWGKESDNAFAILGLFQMGPRTGNIVFSKDYARPVFDVLYEQCPAGKIGNLEMIRETRKYPVVSGEIVKISADCWL